MGYKNTVLVTGGAGFIGSAFLRILVPKHPEWFFINLDALTYAGDLKKVESISESANYTFVHGNICDRTLVEKLFDEYKINWVVNFAAESHVDNSIKDSTAFIQTNVAGTHVLLDVAKKKWLVESLREMNSNYRFLQISTDEVYGSMGLEGLPWTENYPIQPSSPYSASKAAAELICQSYYKTFGLPILITRSSNNYGPYQSSEKFIPTVIKSILDGKPVPIYGNGKNIREWIYVDDNVEALRLILIKGEEGLTYNIGGNNEMSNLDMVNKIVTFLDNHNPQIEYVADRLGHDFRYSVNSSKLRALGWEPKTSIDDGLNKTITYLSKALI
jgi:dTDP-glucose 4,6-dehydratase